MRKWAWLGQWLAALMVAAGLAVEGATGAHTGYIIITAGALVFALATKLRRA